MSFKHISNLELLGPQGFCSIFAILVEGIIKRSSVKLIILNVDQWSRRCHFKDLSIALEALMLSKAEPSAILEQYEEHL